MYLQILATIDDWPFFVRLVLLVAGGDNNHIVTSHTATLQRQSLHVRTDIQANFQYIKQNYTLWPYIIFLMR